MQWEQSCFVWTDTRTDRYDDANSRFSYFFSPSPKVKLIYLRFNLFYFYVYLVTINFVASLLRNIDNSCLFAREFPPSIDMLSDLLSLFLYFMTIL